MAAPRWTIKDAGNPACAQNRHKNTRHLHTVQVVSTFVSLHADTSRGGALSLSVFRHLFIHGVSSPLQGVLWEKSSSNVASDLMTVWVWVSVRVCVCEEVW